jgi:hypothetical protein
MTRARLDKADIMPRCRRSGIICTFRSSADFEENRHAAQ